MTSRFASLSLTLVAGVLVATCSASLAQPTTATVAAGGVTVQDTLRQGLIVWAVNAYCPTRDWERYLDSLEGGPDSFSLYGFFGTAKRREIAPQIADLHVRILDELKKRISRGRLQRSHWGLDHDLALSVLALRFGASPQPGRAVEFHGELETSVVLRSTSSDTVIFRQDPPLLVRRIRVPGAKQNSVDDLVSDTAASIYDSLKAAWTRLQAADRQAP